MRGLGEVAPDSVRPVALGPLPGARRAQQRSPARHPRKSRGGAEDGPDRQAPGRLLRRVHGRGRGREEGRRTPRGRLQGHRRPVVFDRRPARFAREAARRGRRRRVQLRLRPGREGLDQGHRRGGPGRPGPAGPGLLFQDRPEVRTNSQAVPLARDQDVRPARRRAESRGVRGRHRDAPGDRARARLDGPRVPPRPGQRLSPDGRRRAGQDGARLRLEPVFRADGSADVGVAERGLHGLRVRLLRPAVLPAARRLEDLPALARRGRGVLELALEGLRQRGVRLRRPQADRRQGAQGALEALRGADRRRARPRPGPALRGAYLRRPRARRARTS